MAIPTMVKFEETLNKWYGKFSKMKPGERLNIEEVGKRDPELFLDICKSFIDDNPDFELSVDMKYLKRINKF